MTLAALTEAIDKLVDADPFTLSDAESIESLHRDLARLEAVVTRAAAAFDAAGSWAPDGARDAASWLAVRCHLPKKEARRRVRLGRRLSAIPSFTDAWLAGELTAAQVGAVARLGRTPVVEALTDHEETLCAQARTLRFESFVKALAYFEQLADPDGIEADELERRDRRSVHLSRSISGLWFGQMTLDPISGTIVDDELRRLEKELFEIDWAAAKERLGRDPIPADLARTPGQRQADALVEMASRSRAAGDGRRPVPLFSVFVGYETLHGRICELANGAVVSPGALLPWLDQALVERAVFGSGPRVEIGPATRLYGGATRRAIELRD
ncbi:MAG TPA: DUF222 domain-containing protein, partial [Acidimicrobiales bacterium]|nr:DUF222 domain-containing protein [Acidimicrobiales bacterium]